MKKIILLSVLIVIAASTFAQPKFRLNLYSSYVFDDGFNESNDANTYFNGQVKGGYQWGGGIEFVTNEYSSVELMYITEAPLRLSISGPV